MITKTPFEEFFRYHDFSLWLSTDEVIESANVKVYHGQTEQTDMIEQVGVYNNKKVKYKLKSGEPSKKYLLVISIQTSNGQKFQDKLKLLVL